MSERRAERFVAEAFLERLSVPHRRHVRAARGRLPVAATASDDIRRRLATVEAGMERLAVAIGEGQGPGMDAALRGRAAELEAERERLMVEMARNETAAQDERSEAERREQLVALAADLRGVWEKANTGQRHDMLAVAIEGVRVIPGDRVAKAFEIAWQPWTA